MSRFRDNQEGAGPQFPPPVPTPSPPPRTSGAAVAGLILGILGFFTAGLAAVPGLICSIVAIVKIRKRRRRMGGMGLAIAGLVCSIAAMLMSVALMGGLFWVKGLTRTVVVSSHLKSLSYGVLLYAEDNKDHFPSPDTFSEDIAPYLGGERSANGMLSSPFAPEAGRAYSMNATLRNTRTVDVQRPIVLLFEAEFGSPAAGGPGHLPARPRSSKGYTIAFTDGSVENIPRERLDGGDWGELKCSTCGKWSDVPLDWRPPEAGQCPHCGKRSLSPAPPEDREQEDGSWLRPLP